MSVAAITFVYNEHTNLPIWLKYYGRLFGPENLYVIDRGSDDGSTEGLGAVNVIRVPRRKFDEQDKTDFMSWFHSSMLSFYDTIITSDCDELLVPDPACFSDLNDYIGKLEIEYVNGIGINVVHMLNEEAPLNLNEPIMRQRRWGQFLSPECKQLLSRTPVRWLPGLHSSNRPPKFDQNLFVFHLKLMDYAEATKRQVINLKTEWSQESLDHNYGRHHRYDLGTFVHGSFLGPMDLLKREGPHPFDFSEEVKLMEERTIMDKNGYHRIPMDISKMVRIPDKFSDCF